jgi:hypothetical protein
MRMTIITLTLILLALPAAAAEPAADPVEVASLTFVRGCVGFMGDYAQLREKLQPGRELYLPQLPPTEAKPFLQGREGEAYSRFDAGVTIVLLKAEEQCAVFVQKVAGDRLFKQLEKDIRVAVSKAFAVQVGGREAKGPLLARFIDLTPIGEYRAELEKQYGPKLPGLRAILTTSEAANPNLQAIITIGSRQP